MDILDEWIKIQKSWIYLEPIFKQNDIATQMPMESNRFNNVDSFFQREMTIILTDPSVLKFCKRDQLVSSLWYLNKEFEGITKSLSVYLESKREFFARFYFLSNEEIIEILTLMKEPRTVQKYLNKIFEGIEYLNFSPNGEILGVYSKEGEYMALKN